MEAVRQAHIIEGSLLLTTFFVKRHVLRGQDGMSGVHHVKRMGQSFASRGRCAGGAASTVFLVFSYLSKLAISLLSFGLLLVQQYVVVELILILHGMTYPFTYRVLL